MPTSTHLLIRRTLWILGTGALVTAFNNCGGFRGASSLASSSLSTPSPSPSSVAGPFVATLSRLCLELDDAGNLTQASCSGDPAQRVTMDDAGDGRFQLKLGGLCVDAGAVGAPALGQPCRSVDRQRWQLARAGADAFVVSNVGGAGCLGALDGATTVGARVYTARCAAGRHQIFAVAGYAKPPTPRRLLNGVAPMLVGQDEHPGGVTTFETAIGHAMDFAVEFGGAKDWADYVGDIGWASGIWNSAAPERAVMWAIPLTVGPGCINCGTTLKDVAAGRNDADITAAARALAKNDPRAIIRLGWEFNGGWYPWGAKDLTRDYVDAYRHVALIYRTQSSAFTFVWCTNLGRTDFDPDLAYPGDDVVDVIGMDVYDFNYANQDAPTRWEAVQNQDFGLRWQVAFADLHRKLLAIPEWGAGANGDNPLFVTNMMKWMKANQYSYQSWWEGDANSGYDSALGAGKYPREAAALKAEL